MESMDWAEFRMWLWNSVDAEYYRRILGAGIAILCYFGALCGVLFWFAKDVAVFMAIAGCTAILPLLAWRLWQLLRIFRKVAYYRFYKTTLSGPRCPKGNNRVFFFPVTIRDSEMGIIQRRTATIYYARKRFGPMLKDYLDRTVTVAWNRETDMIVVIRR